MASPVEQRFIQDTLKEAADYIYKDQTAAIQNAVSEASTGFLLRNRFFDVQASGIQHTHPVYERFLDMKHLNRNGKTIKRKPLHIHNRFMWGIYLRVSDKLMYGFSEEIKEQIIQSLGLENQVKNK